ncbi:MAG: DUF423 domain-containing protein [Bacteroidetes bacterium]|nr:DUF423 domain-containing protein [Bacteroidota bacterium]
MKFFGAAGAIGLLLGVVLGAFAAHFLSERISPEMLGVFETGVRYEMYHSLALLAVAFLSSKGKLFRYAGALFIAGIVFFSFSLYVLAITGEASFGLITPIGGTAFIAGDLFLLVGFLKI